MVFDLFHTLVDPEDFGPKDSRRVEVASELLELDKKDFALYWTNIKSVRNTNASKSAIEFVKDYLVSNGIEIPPAKVLNKVDYAFGEYQDKAILNPRPEVLSVLKTLKSRRLNLGVLTNCDVRELRECPDSPLAPYFKAACFSFNIGSEKPAHRAFEIVLDKLGTIPSRSFYVGDRGSKELEGAKAAGFTKVIFIKAFVSRNGLRSKKELDIFQNTADVTIDSLSELIPLSDFK
ncbi:MAG: HAD family hydrolase [Nitrososphaerales archaeon]